jgi:histidine triad (HIT) family protein
MCGNIKKQKVIKRKFLKEIIGVFYMLTKEQISQIKEQLFKQLENWPESQREAAKEQINSMNDEELEQFLIKNKMIKTEQADNEKQECIFCSIIKNQIPSYKLDENDNAVAVLEINPISKGHTIIIPKEHINTESLSSDIFSFGEEISQKIKHILKPKKVEANTTELFGHGIINILPVYKDETFKSSRKKAKPEELKKVQDALMQEIKPKKEKISDKKIKGKIKIEKLEPEKLPKAPVRMP